jgi:hypothetical protein
VQAQVVGHLFSGHALGLHRVTLREPPDNSGRDA